MNTLGFIVTHLLGVVDAIRFQTLAPRRRHHETTLSHSLRHTFATRLYSKTGDLRLVQRALGHKRITTTEIYARVEDKALRKALDSLRF